MKSLQEKHLQAKEQPYFYQDHIHEWYTQLQNHKTNSVWHLHENKDVVYALAKQLDDIPVEERKPLFGLTMGVKDLFHITSYKTTAGSRILHTMKSPITATVIQDLQNNHALPLAKVSMDEFAMGSFTNTAYLGKTTNINPDYTTGGSSGGSAISLKEQLFDFTIGSDTGGSVRQPAAFCNVVAYKPSYGGLSRYGMIPYASSLDQAGLFTHNIVDLQYVMNSMDIGVGAAMTHAYIKDDNDDTHIGLKKQIIQKSNLVGAYFPFFLQSHDIKDEIKYLYQKELDTLKDKGVILMPIDLPSTSMMFHTASIYYTISCAEAASNLAKYQGVYYGTPLSDFVMQMEREGRSIKSYQEAIALYRSRYLGNDVKARIVMGNELLSSENFHTVFEKAQLMRQHLKMEINHMLNNVDFLVLPTFPSLTPKWSEIELMSQEEVFMSDFLTVAFSLTGHPVVVMPSSHEMIHSDRSIKNTGFQYVGKAFYDRQLINDCVWIGATK